MSRVGVGGEVAGSAGFARNQLVAQIPLCALAAGPDQGSPLGVACFGGKCGPEMGTVNLYERISQLACFPVCCVGTYDAGYHVGFMAGLATSFCLW